MAQNKKYSAHLQKLRMSGASIPGVDPALNSYVLMLLRSNQISAIDDKNKPAVRTSACPHTLTPGSLHTDPQETSICNEWQRAVESS